ncbi:serine/threonine protein phosphatase 1 [Lactobacillus colini]|uniref:Serine/threonine protein phosphatase 1 n=1 Tax=Lactobacillus colini TaxID=1819254 RepID=A0ABS4ME35_9LACO|nr:metallophosphoesterase family protein [Lactobacillus colini]MBP2057950.1 serine/threonine protein phosphatase 1 [Lactobacillus colini]
MQKIINQTLETNENKNYYIFISDIHGNLETLELIKKARKDYPDAQLVGGGDYIDERWDVKPVVDYLQELASHNNAIILRGNHEQMLINYAEKCEHQDGIWFYNGGAYSLDSLYGRELEPDEVRQTAYYQFFKSMPIMYETPHIIFVHAGVRPDNRYNDPSSYDKLDIYHGKYDYDFYRVWARQEYWFNEAGYFAHNLTGKVIITGHTPTCSIVGKFDDNREMEQLPLTSCRVRVVDYPAEPARIFTDGGSHSDADLYPHNDGNVVVLDKMGKIQKVYNYQNTLSDN